MYTIISSANSRNLTSSFPIHIPLITFHCLIALARISSTILNRYGESGHPCLIPGFSGIVLSFSLFNLMLAVGLLYIDFVMFRYVPCIPDLSKIFYHEGVLYFVEGFSASNEMIMWGFFFQFVYVVDYIDRFSYVEPSLHL